MNELPIEVIAKRIRIPFCITNDRIAMLRKCQLSHKKKGNNICATRATKLTYCIKGKQQTIKFTLETWKKAQIPYYSWEIIKAKRSISSFSRRELPISDKKMRSCRKNAAGTYGLLADDFSPAKD
jgi:hypothetical protein